MWTAPKQIQPGDLLFFYFMTPRKAIQFVARAATYPVFDPKIRVNSINHVDPNQWWVEPTPMHAITPVSFQELRSFMGGHLILKGKPSHYLPPLVVTRIMKRVGVETADAETRLVLKRPVGAPELPDPARVGLDRWRRMADGPLKLEAQVEQYVVEPLLRLALPRGRGVSWKKAPHIAGGIPDYAVLNGDAPTGVVEVKLGVRVPKRGDWSNSPDFIQVMKYSHTMCVPAVLVDSNKIFLIPRGASSPAQVIQRSKATGEDLRTVGRHLTT